MLWKLSKWHIWKQFRRCVTSTVFKIFTGTIWNSYPKNATLNAVFTFLLCIFNITTRFKSLKILEFHFPWWHLNNHMTSCYFIFVQFAGSNNFFQNFSWTEKSPLQQKKAWIAFLETWQCSVSRKLTATIFNPFSRNVTRKNQYY